MLFSPFDFLISHLLVHSGFSHLHGWLFGLDKADAHFQLTSSIFRDTSHITRFYLISEYDGVVGLSLGGNGLYYYCYTRAGSKSLSCHPGFDLRHWISV